MGLLDEFKFPTYTEKYEAGLPDFQNPCPIKIQFKDSHVDFILPKGFLKTQTVSFYPKDIVEVSFEGNSFRSAGGAAVGAIAGGLLTGGVGLLAGAAIGGRRKREGSLQLTVLRNDKQYNIHLAPSKTMNLVYSKILGLAEKV